jgi:hypothetical protein
MLFIVVSAVIGAGAAFLMLWPFGILIACLGAPVGGGIFAGLTALWLGWRSATASRRDVANASNDKVPERRASGM